MNNATQTIIDTPVGAVRIVAEGAALVGVYFEEHSKPAVQAAREDPHLPVLAQAAQELAEYFAGERQMFITPLAPRGTEFQREVWHALTTIPYGEHRSYAQIAEAIGNPQAMRAVGAANGRNPLSIFVPCHRVLGADGSLTGYAGGLPIKRWLLEHEQTHQGGHGIPRLFDT